MVSKGEEQATIGGREEYEIWSLLNLVRDGMIKVRDRELRPLQISGVQGGVLWAIHTLEKLNTPATPTEISRWMFREPPTTWALVARMEKQGLLKCLRNTQGTRQVLVEMTPKGKGVLRRFLEERKVIPRILISLTPEERRQFTMILGKLRDAISQELVVMPPM